MKLHIYKRLSSLFLVVSFSISVMVGVSVSASAVSVEAVSSVMAVYELLSSFSSIGDDVSQRIANSVSFAFNRVDQRDCDVVMEELQRYNSGGWFGDFLSGYPDAYETVSSLYSFIKTSGNVPGPLKLDLRQDSAQNGIYRPWIVGGADVSAGWYEDVNGKYPYCSAESYHAYHNQGNPSTPKPFDGRWVQTNSIRDSKKLSQKSFADMDATRADLANKYPNSYIRIAPMNVGGLDCYVIRRLEEGPGNRDWVWCDSSGKPFVYVDPSTQGSAQDWNYDKIQDITNNQTEEITNIVTEQGDKIDKLLEINNETGDTKINVPVQVGPNEWSLLTLNADSITIDRSEDNRTIYNIDSHDVTYNVENNFYEYNYYTYNFEYTYNNTYVTYIGSTAEYQPKEWALYYELPDGRSSADLTEEDIAGLSFQFQDMVNYKRSATDTSLRALYHFDGNTEDSSYWSTQGAFTWNKSASITYMESNAFNGALYLDEKEHQFSIALPSSIGSQDFTLQWRYYQNSATTTDHNENYVTIGGQKLLGWSEQFLYSLGSTKLSTGLSVGTWQELALVRDGGTLYIYHNGVKVGSASMASVLTNEIVFYFGANSRAYSMLDEMRFVNFAIAKKGAAYTPTSVPYDTNSVLVLPDGAEPVADEFWRWDTTIEPIQTFDLTAGYIKAPPSCDSGNAPSLGYSYIYWDLKASSDIASRLDKGSWFYTGDLVKVLDGFISLVNSSSTAVSSSGAFSAPSYNYNLGFRSNKTKNIPLAGIGLFVHDGTFSSTEYPCTLTVVDRDMHRYSVTVDTSKNFSTATFAWGSLSFGRKGYCTSSSNDTWKDCMVLLFDLNPNTTLDIVYIEIVPGTEPNTGHEFVSCIYDSTELQPNTAAIQSTIPVKGYTVGGVRPTFPQRGDVWMPVEGSRISGVYIYNGQAWEETNARYWTGKRWIPIYAFDLVTLQDMWDVSSSTGDEITPSITSEYGFWNWWKNAWNDFTAKLFPALGTGSGGGGSGPGSGSGTIPDGSLPGEPGEGEDDGWSVFDLLIALKDGAWAIVTGTVKTAFGGIKGVVGVVTDIGGFFTSIGEVTDTIKDFGG